MLFWFYNFARSHYVFGWMTWETRGQLCQTINWINTSINSNNLSLERRGSSVKGMNISLSYCILSHAISKNRKSRGNHDHVCCAMICNLPKDILLLLYVHTYFRDWSLCELYLSVFFCSKIEFLFFWVWKNWSGF